MSEEHDNKPEPMEVDFDRSTLFTKQRCGNCIHLKRIAHPAYSKVCVNHGITEIHKPCFRFSPDPTKIKFKNERLVRNVVEAIQDLSPEKLRILSTMFDQEARSRRYGFSMGMTVYIHAFGGDYISNYRRMKVIYADKKYVHLQSHDGFSAMVFHATALTPAKWKKKRTALENAERITDPNYYRYVGTSAKAKEEVKKIREHRIALEFDSTQRHDFSLTSSQEKRKAGGVLPLTDLIRTR